MQTPYGALERTVRVRAEAGGGVTIELDAAAGVPTISGIALRKR